MNVNKKTCGFGGVQKEHHEVGNVCGGKMSRGA